MKIESVIYPHTAYTGNCTNAVMNYRCEECDTFHSDDFDTIYVRRCSKKKVVMDTSYRWQMLWFFIKSFF
jgi:hypothetical protein